MRACRGSLEVGDVLSDLSANPMEVFILGIHGKLIAAPVSSMLTQIQCGPCLCMGDKMCCSIYAADCSDC